jgi:hypothetical protein
VKYTTKDAVIEQVIVPAIEASGVARADEYDLDAIFDATFEYDPDLQAFVQDGTVEDFWAAVEKAALP